MSRTRTVALMALVLLATAAVAPVAVAGTPSKATPPAGLLTRADVPATLGTPKPGSQNYDVVAEKAGPISLCTAVSGPTELTVPGAAGWSSMVVLTGGGGYREVNEQVATYASPAEASAAFAGLTAKAARCNGVTRTPIDGNGTYDMGYYRNSNSSGTTGDGVHISIDSRVQKASHDINGSVTTTYTVYRQSGSSVVLTWLYQNGTARTSLEQRAAVDSLSAQLTAAL